VSNAFRRILGSGIEIFSSLALSILLVHNFSHVVHLLRLHNRRLGA
jgi:hypothetical protein